MPIRFVQIGSVSGADITLPSAVLRSSAIVLMGSGIGSVGVDRLLACIGELFSAGLTIATREVPLSEIGRVWNDDNGPLRTVLIP